MAKAVSDVDDLYRLEPGEFVAARDELAKRVRTDGDRDAAAEIKALRRPSAAAWAVNQAARDHPELVDAVVDAGAELARAQSAMLAGRGRDQLRTASTAKRDAVAAATKVAVALAGESHRDAIAATFDAAATDEEAAEAVRSGRLAKELDAPSGFAMLVDLPEPPPPADEHDERDDRAAEARHRADEAEATAAAARRAAEDAEQRRRQLADDLERATDEARALRTAAEEAETDARQLRRKADKFS